MWTAEILSVQKDLATSTVSITYKVTDGKEERVVTPSPMVMGVDVAEMKKAIWTMAQQAADELNQEAAKKQAVQDFDMATVVGVVDLTPPVVVVDPAKVALGVWLEAKADYLLKKKILDSGFSKANAGAKTVTQGDVDAALALMKTLYKDEYGVFL